MNDLLAFPWLVALVGGLVVLGLVIAYGMMRTNKSTARERALRDAGTREVYKEE